MEDSTDVWSKLLSDSNIDNTNQEINLIVLGNSKNLCLTLIDGILHSMNLPLLKKRDIDLFYYSYATVGFPDRKNSSGDYLGVMHIHCINDIAYKDYLYESSQPIPLNKTMFVIAIDFKDTCNIMMSIEKWLLFIEDYCSLIMKDKDDLYERQKEEWCDRMKSFVHHYQPSLNKDSTQSPINPILPNGLLTTNLGVPLYIICTNTEVISSSNQFNTNKLKFIQKFIRSKCLEYGASLSYYNTIKDTSISLIKSYILSVFFSSYYTLPSPFITSIDELFYPAGYDNLYAIQDILGDSELGGITDFNAVIERPMQTIKKSISQPPIVQSEEEFLASLMRREEPTTPQRPRKTIASRDSAVKSRVSVSTQLKHSGEIQPTDFFEGLISKDTRPRMSVNVRNLRRSEAVTKAAPSHRT